MVSNLPVICSVSLLDKILVVHLIVVELAHLDLLPVLVHLAIVLIDLVLDRVIEGQNVPSVEGLRFDMPLSTLLKACLDKVDVTWIDIAIHDTDRAMPGRG